jgi:hypothetical protein
MQIAGGLGSPAKLRRRSQTSRWAGRCADRQWENSSPGLPRLTCRDSGILHLGTASIAGLQRTVTPPSRTVTNRASPCEAAAAISSFVSARNDHLRDARRGTAQQRTSGQRTEPGITTGRHAMGWCDSPACRAGRLRLAVLVTRFVTRTLCHVVIPGATGETRATPVRWSGGTSAICVRLCETTACRLITQRSWCSRNVERRRGRHPDSLSSSWHLRSQEKLDRMTGNLLEIMLGLEMSSMSLVPRR